MRIVDVKMVAARAHALWEAAGQPEGQSERFWLQAERQLASDDPPEAAADVKASPKAKKRAPAKPK